MSLGVPSISVKDDADVPGDWMTSDFPYQAMLIGSIEGPDCEAHQPAKPSMDCRAALEKIRLVETQAHGRYPGPSGSISSSISCVAILATLMAAPITSAGRFSPRGPFGILGSPRACRYAAPMAACFPVSIMSTMRADGQPV